MTFKCSMPFVNIDEEHKRKQCSLQTMVLCIFTQGQLLCFSYSHIKSYSNNVAMLCYNAGFLFVFALTLNLSHCSSLSRCILNPAMFSCYKKCVEDPCCLAADIRTHQCHISYLPNQQMDIRKQVRVCHNSKYYD